MSGFNFVTDFATCFKRVVLPAFGGDTIIPLCPFPTGDIMSIILIARFPSPVSKRMRSLGKIGVMFSKFILSSISLG